MFAKNSGKPTPASTRSKRSTASDTDTRKNRWLRLGGSHRSEFDHLLDFYWGGPERRITGITLRIIGVNAIALVMLAIGMIYLGQYQKNLIEDKLENFRDEVELVSQAISHVSLSPGKKESDRLDREQAINMARQLVKTIRKRIILFDSAGRIMARPDVLNGEIEFEDFRAQDRLRTVRVLKNMAEFVLKRLPDNKKLPSYPETLSDNAWDYPDAPQALAGSISLSAWLDEEGGVVLSTAAPLYKDGKIFGAVLLTRKARDIEHDVIGVWINILKAFAATLILTILLSIYLSGVIAGPLRKLASAAEGVRKGKLKYTDIPDLGDRHDEIGELSIALRQMTKALWDRMDSTEAFAADVAHELKNPLSSLRSAVETAAVVKTESDRGKLMAIIRHDVDRLDRLITDISNVSRLDAELSREALERVNLKHLLNTIVDSHRTPLERDREEKIAEGRTKAGHAEIRFESPAEDLYVWGLDGRLAQVFQNLLSNALSFSPPGGMISIGVAPESRQVAVTFEDQGPGIPENKMDAIFERFYTQRPEHEAYGTHSGLGLSICRQIVEALGGEIFAENIRDRHGKITGARFTVLLNKA